MYYVYILKSVNSNHYYVGHASKLQGRFSDHNSGLVKSTKKYLPWKIIHTEAFETKSEAYKRELQIKSYNGGNAFKHLIKSVSG
jgi:putative endonuclease